MTFHKQTAGPKICTVPQESFYPTPTSDVVLEENEQGKIPQRLKPGPLREMGTVVLPKEQNENPGMTPVLGPGSLTMPALQDPHLTLDQQLLCAFFSLLS